MTGLQSNSFEIANIEVKGGIVVFPQQFFTWDISAPEDIRVHHFDILDHIKPRPSYIVVGTGSKKYFLDGEVITKLKSYGVRFDVLDTVEA